MRKLWIGLAIVAALGCVVLFYMLNRPVEVAKVEPAPPVAKEETKPEVKPPSIPELLTLVNEERAKAGVKPLVIDERLNQSAQIKADDMTANNYMAHEDVHGKHGYEYAREKAPNCLLVSENIYKSVNPEWHTSFTAITTWMSSPSHKEAILDSKYDSTGFGVSGPSVVEHFCDLP